MSATNHTTNYNLPQFVGSDKPTWLGDFNGAMTTIDTQMKANADLGTLAKTTADTAETNAQTALSTANGAETTANTANTTANSALTKALANESALANGDIYSSTEIQVGKWIDGSDIYRKVIETNITINPGQNIIAHNITNFKECIKVNYHFIYQDESFFHWNNDIRDLYVDTTNIVITSGNTSPAGFTKTVIILEYIKNQA